MNEQKAVLPTLTFCNLDPFTSIFAINLLAEAQLNKTIDDNPVDSWKIYLQLEDYLNVTRGHYLTDEEKLKLANFDQAVIPQNNGNEDIINQFERIFHPRYFGCLRYNSNGNLTTTSTDYFIDTTFFVDSSFPTVFQLYPANLKGYYLFIQNRFLHIFDL